jgi:hypothetical protein
MQDTHEAATRPTTRTFVRMVFMRKCSEVDRARRAYRMRALKFSVSNASSRAAFAS